MTEESSNSCIACGWSPAKQKLCRYSSHVKLIYGASNRGVWSIGSDLILKERPDEGPKAEVKILSELAAHNDIPAPKLVRDWVDRDGRYFVLEERIDGQTLEEAWPSLSESQRLVIADQVVQVRNQLRKLTSTAIQGVDHGPCFPALLFFDYKPRGPFHSDAELWDALSRTLHDPPRKTFPTKALESLKKRLPPCEPYVLTHCDLNMGNIMVKDGELAGILDWEYAAYYPIWYEYVSAAWGWTDMDAEWKKLLRQRMDVHEDAKEFWTDLYNLREYPKLDKKGQEVLEKLLSD
ncbi:aminoglycoside phosphotransferase family protein [Aspergillus ibericus CBS 121593]|uniref:Kinase-like protein n=1 Tax=Aspergillus ibericus CBS 121593 TaxID=1448316 RepID=A0A395H1D1_9EURO|nr:kinase-like protein [Aspergillus ibericus CBS 121593]RAL01400.1 kinase-like protein [Aspergillus ibericus CBS 121593]